MDLSDSQRVGAVRALAVFAPYAANLSTAAKIYWTAL
jgi:hypothetical protein